MFRTPHHRPRRSWGSAFRTARRVGPRFSSLREAVENLAGHSRASAAFALAFAALTMLAVVGVIAVLGWATVAATDSREGLQILVFVVVTILSTATLGLIGRRPWIYVVEVLLWRREAPPGTVCVYLHVAEAARERVPRVLSDAGFDFVERLPHLQPPAKAAFPSTRVGAWDPHAQCDTDAAVERATTALAAHGIRFLPSMSMGTTTN